MFIKVFPDEIDLLGFFEVEPVLRNTDDLHFSYKINDDDGVEMTFSFCATAGWIRSVISFNGRDVTQYISENVNVIELKKDSSGEYLYSEVVTDNLITKFEIRRKPYIFSSISTLVR